MKYCLILLLLFGIIPLGNAQTGHLSGRVIDDNSKVVAGATVTLKEIGIKTITDDQGKYEFSAVKYGSYTISITSIVTQSHTEKVDIKSSKSILNVKVKQSKQHELRQVSVEGKTEKRKIDERCVIEKSPNE
jgi:hypothetical protein